jgi:predicted MPP superfamily phosphohydrolase
MLRGLAVTAGTSICIGGYAVAEPHTLIVKSYRPQPAQWPAHLKLRLALLADFHACDPWMSVDRIGDIVERTNALNPDAVLLLGDYVAGRKMLRFSRNIAERDWARPLAGLRAPYGVHAVLGNHDWWDDQEAQLLRRGPPAAQRALEAAGIPVYENRATRLVKDGQPFWITGLGDQTSYAPRAWAAGARVAISARDGTHDLPGTLRLVTDDAPVVMMAHEPDIFDVMPHRVALTVCGHTHGGQVRLPGISPYIPSRFGERFVYGHIVERGRHLIVSSGLGCSGVPVRFGVPPEIVIVELGSWSAGAQS